ncbi:DUF3887 domain-containing protein [Actinacidiphila acidipaludis]|uniref:DUF3887 domain-containing protein n=1 Tax=Actinacidiphila acidipaludis TaxID=2873382 RepID=A0ABS7QLH2_9ACTN|nr:DUF3887 domain-containing protein [Streptomyces acidipaludis]MBY8882737.1 DUF3887 domain-containing protein [Streptomyces acidipaludis]
MADSLPSSPSLAALAASLARQASALAETLGSPLAPQPYLDLVRRARDLDGAAEQVLKLCVQQSRDAGHTWQEIGDLLGVSRQAAFQRFGKPIDPRTGEPMDKTVRMADAAERALAVVSAVLEDRMDDVRPSFNDEVRAKFTDEVRGDGLAAVTGLVGAFEGFADAEPFVRRIGDHTVVDIPLRYEAGDMKARVAFDTDEKVAGVLILAPETP